MATVNNSLNINPTTGTAIVGNGSGFSNVAYSTTPGASTIPEWDANSNLSANSLIAGYTTTATAAGTTTLTVASTQLQYFTGTTTQTVLLPVTSTLVLGQSYKIVNNSTGIITVQSSGANTIQAMASNTTLIVTVILTSGTTAASWEAEYQTSTYGITTVGDVTSGHVAFDGTAGTTLTGTTAGLTLTAATNSIGDGASINLISGLTSAGTGIGGSVNLTASNSSGATGSAAGGVTCIAGTGGSGIGGGGGMSFLSGDGGTGNGTGGPIAFITGHGGTGGNSAAGDIDFTGGNSHGTDFHGSGIRFQTGNSTGLGATGKISLFGCNLGSASSSSTIGNSCKLEINGQVNLTSGSLITIENLGFSASGTAGGTITYSVHSTDGTDYIVASGIVGYSIINKSGVITGTISLIGSEVQATTLPTITNVWSLTSSGTTAKINITSTIVGITPTQYYIVSSNFANDHIGTGLV